MGVELHQTITVSTRASSTALRVDISVASSTLERLSTPYVSSMVGWLPGNRRLARPIIVSVEPDGEEVLVSEPHYAIHAAGETEGEAIAAFRRVLSGYLDFLTAHEDTLSAHMQEQLDYLRDIIQPA